MIIFSSLFKREGRKDKPPKYPCRKCIYYKACGNGGRREPCPTRKTREEYDELIRKDLVTK